MKKALFGLLSLVMLFAASVVLAQQAAAPAPVAPAAATPAPAAPAQAPAAAQPKATPASSFMVARMEIAGGVENRQPTGIAASFPASTEKVYCYLELNNVTANTSFTYVWTFGLNEMAKVTQTANRTVAKYRTWSSKALGGLKGDWKVDLVDASGTVLKTATFKVE